MINHSIAELDDDFGPCEWCGKPIEAGEEYWHSFEWDHICCSKVCCENAVERSECKRNAELDAQDYPCDQYGNEIPYARSYPRLRRINDDRRF